ncbi:hypothetical protein PCC9214_05786 [Planktothrix tepida]|uniref:Uncharacterized protein n=1 Tax=Planktothrix tepida PCC 9214 TaxID=671072 RepID=A0A1J1LUW9_9CYAN|nr:sigma-70 family RNA polymerase sigma factor [Planktothrix tepida]CAD5990398.1 hypothetical protein PCC9214_05786 [Planktothrix tepida]CUR35377.1 conserved hypothetical protein [Planktothrix tepida PCC 9214]
MDDASLCQLIREALHDPNKAKALALMIDQLPVIKAYLGKGWLPYYDEAVPMTERDVERNIKRFPKMYRLNLETVNCQNASEAANVRKHFINWVVMILKRDCHDVSRRANRQIIISINTPIGEDGSTLEKTIDSSETLNPNDTPRLSGLDKMIAEEDFLKNQEQLALMVRLLDKNLSNCYPDGYSKANCYELFKRRVLKKPPQQWRDIAEELQISLGTVTSHWHRKCKPMLPNIE